MSDLVVDHRLPVRLLGVEYLLEFKEEVVGGLIVFQRFFGFRLVIHNATILRSR